MTPHDLDLIAGWVSLVLTLMVFSYLLGDNFLYRLAVAVLVGAAAAYIAIVTVESVLVPWLDDTVLAKQGDRDTATITTIRLAGIIPFMLGALLLLKATPRTAPLGNLGLSTLIGIGTAIALSGAIAGTIIPLARDTGEAVGDDAVDGIVILGGVITTLLYFQYLATRRDGAVRRLPALRLLGLVGQGFISVTLGALYGAAVIASISVFSQVIDTQLQFILDRVGG